MSVLLGIRTQTKIREIREVLDRKFAGERGNGREIR